MFGPMLAVGVALGTAAVVVANPVSAPGGDIRIPAVALSSGGHAADMLDEDFLRALAPEPAGSTNPVAVFKDLVAVLVASAAHLGRTAVSDEAGDGTVRPELTAASYPYIAAVSGGAGSPSLSVDAPLPAVVGAALPVVGAPNLLEHGSSRDAQILSAPEQQGTPAPMPEALPQWVEADLQWAVDHATAAVSALPNPRQVLADSLTTGKAPLSAIVGSVADSLEAELSVAADAIRTAVPNMGSKLLAPGAESGPTHRSGLLGASMDSADGPGAESSSPAGRTPRNGASGSASGSVGGSDKVSGGRNGD